MAYREEDQVQENGEDRPDAVVGVARPAADQTRLVPASISSQRSLTLKLYRKTNRTYHKIYESSFCIV